MLDKYINFLKTGSDKCPIEVFKILDIDIESDNIYLNAIKYFENLINEYEKIYFNEEVK